ncbi:unnamed protein product [Moneuplotes crassus]|uniref:Uncharacterized protein n=1 Tax=Euplotes crassus TaxID=5936 RepID=A0AAD2CWG0_EUPCR|nr:unnamed protein product [Moneuplotes crassus]
MYINVTLSLDSTGKYTGIPTDFVDGLKYYDNLCRIPNRKSLEKILLAAELKKAGEGGELEESYALLDGRLLKISTQRFQCPEFLFQPDLGGRECKSVRQSTYDSIMTYDLNVRNALYANIILSQGTTMFSGLGERLCKEMKNWLHRKCRSRPLRPQTGNTQYGEEDRLWCSYLY